jgi:hypothetical protein
MHFPILESLPIETLASDVDSFTLVWKWKNATGWVLDGEYVHLEMHKLAK